MKREKTNRALEIMLNLGLILDVDDQVFIEALVFKNDYPKGVVPCDCLHLFIYFKDDETVCDKIHQIMSIDNYSHHCLYRKEDIDEGVDTHIQLAFNL